MKPLLLALCFFLSLSAAPAAPPAPAPADVPATLRAMLLDYRRYAETKWRPDPTNPDMGFWGSGHGNTANNEGVRALSTTALVYALLAHDGDTAFPVAARVEPALRYAAAIHTTGTRVGTDGQKWGDSWQSAMWAANLGTAAWLTKATLAPDTLAAIERVVGHEADRFVGQAPPAMEPGDTKSEENAWNLTAPAAAILLMPHDSRVTGWQTAVLRYGFNTSSVEANKTSTAPADGKTIEDWVTTAQLYPDYTLENHNIFHPVYAMVGPATNAQAAVDYKLGGLPIPDALSFNVLKGWQMLQYIALPDGEWLYPQGLDWDLHDYEHLHYLGMLATLYHDPAAALLEQRLVAYARRRQLLNGDGSFVGPSGSLGFAREAVQAERVVFAFLMHREFGPPPPSTPADWQHLISHLDPVRAFPYVGMVIQRAPCGLVSFSWKNHLTAQVVPQSETHLDQPYVTTPSLETLVGGFTLQGQSKANALKFTVTHHSLQTTADSFTAAIDASINAGSLRQQLAIYSLAPGLVAYIDRVTALRPVTITEERGILIGVENDEVSGGIRHLSSATGTLLIPAGQAQDHALSGPWADIDDRLGLITALDPALLYRAVGPPNRAGAREDYLLGAYHGGPPRPFAPGDLITERAALLLPDSTAAETAKLAAHVTADRAGGALTLHFATPNGQSHTLSLAADGAAIKQP